MLASASYKTLFDRMLGASLLETDVYEQAAIDASMRTQATLAVIVTAFAAGVGALGGGLTGFVLGAGSAIAGWIIYVFATYWLATKRFAVPPTLSNLNATVRSLGLASSPRVFLFLTLVPEVGLLVGLFVHAWALIATVLAVRTALDMELRPAVLTAAGGLAPMFIVWALAYVIA